jgi:hypothetical protein
MKNTQENNERTWILKNPSESDRDANKYSKNVRAGGILPFECLKTPIDGRKQ